jgi:hypothetical protein
MAQIPVINNHTGDEGEVDEAWLERWPDDFTPLSDDHTPLAEQDSRVEEDPTATPPLEQTPSDGNEEETE